MTRDLSPRRSRAGAVWIARAAGLALAACALAPRSAWGQARPRSFVSHGFLTGGGQATTGVPEARPYFLGWNARIDPPEELGAFETPLEPGGVAADPRTGWVYVATRHGRVVCLDGGKVRWSVEVGASILAPPTVWQDSVVVGTGQGVLAVLNKVTGARRVRAILGDQLITKPVVVEQQNGPAIALVGSSQDTLYAVELQYAQKLWTAHRDQPAPFTVYGFARPVVLHDSVFIGFADGTVEARDLTTGAQKWAQTISPSGSLVDVDALGTDGHLVYATSYSGGVYALQPADGAALWRTPMSGAARLLVDGPRVIAVAPGVMQSLRASDGKVEWRFTFGHRIAETPAATQGVVVLAQNGGPVYFVDEHTGTPLGLFMSGSGTDSPPAMNGQILFALTNGGRLYSMAVVP